MTRNRRRNANAVASALVIILVAAASPVMLATRDDSALAGSRGVATDFSLQGAKYTAFGHDATFLFEDFRGLDPDAHALVIVAPSVGYTRDEVARLHAFLAAGGHVLVADKGGVGSELLDALGAGVAMSPVPVYTPAFEGEPERIVAVSTGILAAVPEEVAMMRPVRVSGGEAILVSPELTWLDRNGNGIPDLDEPLARNVVLAARAPVGEGLLVVVGDSDVLTGSEDALTRALLDEVASGDRILVFDEAHRVFSDPFASNGLLAGSASATVRTGILMSTIALVAFAVFAPRFHANAPKRPSPLSRGRDDVLLREALSELPQSGRLESR